MWKIRLLDLGEVNVRGWWPCHKRTQRERDWMRMIAENEDPSKKRDREREGQVSLTARSFSKEKRNAETMMVFLPPRLLFILFL